MKVVNSPSMGAAVAECGRSLSAWRAVHHTTTGRVSPVRVIQRNFR
jgi:hypothetical protein